MVFQTVIGGYRSLELVSWANGTPSQLAAMLDAHYAGRLNLSNYWSIGDSRTVALDAIESNTCTGSIGAQTAQLVLMNAGGKTLVNAEHGVTTCAFVVGFKNSIGVGKYNDPSSISDYSNSAVRLFLNNKMFLALPSDMQSLFKTFINTTTKWSSSTSSLVQTEDLLALPAGVELTGSVPSGAMAGEGSQFTYYNTSANRIKTVGGTAYQYWLRTLKSSGGPAYATVNGAVNSTSANPTTTYGISPFGVI